MKIIDIVYSPICKSTGAMIRKEGTDIQINIIPFHLRLQKMGNGRGAG